MLIELPAKKYNRRVLLAPRAAGSVQRAPASMRIVQMAMSASARAAQEFGGGASGLAAPSSAPAITVTLVPRPALSVNRAPGTRSLHIIVKCGGTILDTA